MGKIKMFLVNLAGLLKAMATVRISWGAAKHKLLRVKIDPQAKIYTPVSATDFTLGAGSYISANAFISNTSIGKFCSVGPNFLCGWGTHPINGISTSPVFYSTQRTLGYTFSSVDKVEEMAPVTIGNDVFIGANVTVLNGVTIGDGAVIGAGAVVSKNIPPYAVAVGCPIQIIKYRFDPETIERLLSLKWWDKEEQDLQLLEKNFFDVQKILTQLETVAMNTHEPDLKK